MSENLAAPLLSAIALKIFIRVRLALSCVSPFNIVGMLWKYLSLSLMRNLTEIIQVIEIRRYYASIIKAVAERGRSEARDRNGLQILHPNRSNWAETRGSRVQLLTRDSAGRTYPFGPMLTLRFSNISTHSCNIHDNTWYSVRVRTWIRDPGFHVMIVVTKLLEFRWFLSIFATFLTWAAICRQRSRPMT